MTADVGDFFRILLSMLLLTRDLGATFLWYLVPAVEEAAGPRCVGGDVDNIDMVSDVVCD